MPEHRSESIKTARLSKNIWLKHTLGKIGDVGVAAIQIESLARELKVTKGSFYWHFKDRDSLLSETLKYWYNSATIAIGLAGKRDFNAPRDRLRYFFTLALNKGPDVPGGPIEQALREWARVSDIYRTWSEQKQGAPNSSNGSRSPHWTQHTHAIKEISAPIRR